MKYFITTPIYYVNDELHIGHAYTTIACDIIARWMRLSGREVFFLTGTDEHGQKIAVTAQEKGLTPRELVDSVVLRSVELWKKLNISYDRFIRTTEESHIRVVREVWEKISKNGDIYLGSYEGWYCLPCETFYTEAQAADKKCPGCNRALSFVQEESYFFRLSKYGERLLEYYASNREFILPETRRNEVLSFVKAGLKDISVSRLGVKWGIPVPGDERHTIYVWFDALFNYLSGSTTCGYDFWPASMHIMAKDIVKFHAVYWPAFLMAAGYELPRRLFVHGYWTAEGDKMSKSKNNFIRPQEVVEKYDVDTFRFLLFRGVPFGLDSDFSWALAQERYNAELVNSLGNIVSRVLAMCVKYEGNNISDPDFIPEERFSAFFEKLPEEFDYKMDRADLSGALDSVFDFLSSLNRYIVEKEPWKMVKTDRAQTLQVLHNLLFCLQNIAPFIHPFMPETANKILSSLGLPAIGSENSQVPLLAKRGGIPAGMTGYSVKIGPVPHLFERK